MDTLVVNAGSSSLKAAGFAEQSEGYRRVWIGQVEGVGHAPHAKLRDASGQTVAEERWPTAGPADHPAALGWLLARVPDFHPGRVGHRVVHGGPDLTTPHRIDDALLTTVRKLSPLAPLHLPANLQGIEAAKAAFPEAPQYACFDTAFHRSHPWVADTYALPRRYHELGIRRYGFHGLSYEFIARRLAEIDPAVAAGRVVVCHLGNGASACAIHAGRSVECTMGFSPADGLCMGTRCGQLDPGVILYLQLVFKEPVEKVLKLLNQESGLLGLSGISSDMRELLASDVPAAREAVDYFVHRCAMSIASLATAMGGLDGIVFTAGIGENAAPVRAAVLKRLAWLCVQLDGEANDQHGPRITSNGSPIVGYVIPTDEELVIARSGDAALQ